MVVILLSIAGVAVLAFFLSKQGVKLPVEAAPEKEPPINKKLVDTIQKCMYEGGIAIRQLNGSVVCLDKSAVKWVNQAGRINGTPTETD